MEIPAELLVAEGADLPRTLDVLLAIAPTIRLVTLVSQDAVGARHRIPAHDAASVLFPIFSLNLGNSRVMSYLFKI